MSKNFIKSIKIIRKTISRTPICLRYFIILYVPIFILLASTVAVSLYKHLPISLFFCDPAAVAHINPLTGLISNVGVLLWAFCTAICLFSAFILYFTDKGEYSTFTFYAGIITLILMLDDFFMIHEVLGSKYLHVNEKMFFGTYLLLICLFFVRFIKVILSTRFFLLAVSLLCFAISIFFDIFLNKFIVTGSIFFEDGFKLLGIVSWFGYFVSICFYKILNSVSLNGKHHHRNE